MPPANRWEIGGQDRQPLISAAAEGTPKAAETFRSRTRQRAGAEGMGGGRGGGRTGNTHAVHPPVDVHLVCSNGLSHTLSICFGHGSVCRTYCATAHCGTYHSTISWTIFLVCLLDRINEPSNQSCHDPGVHMLIDGTCQVARQCFWRCFMLERNANKRAL